MAETQRPIALHDLPSEALDAARRGASDGIAAVYEAYAATLLRTATRLTGSVSDAEDIVHDVFVGLPEYLRRYEHRGQLESWLRALVVRVALDRMRRDMRRQSKLASVAQWLTATLSASRELQSREDELKRDLTQHLASLPAALRVVFVLRFFEDQSYESIAVSLQITPGAARVRYNRALQRLRSSIEAAP